MIVDCLLNTYTTSQSTKENLTIDTQGTRPFRDNYLVTNSHVVDRLALGIHSFLSGWLMFPALRYQLTKDALLGPSCPEPLGLQAALDSGPVPISAVASPF